MTQSQKIQMDVHFIHGILD